MAFRNYRDRVPTQTDVVIQILKMPESLRIIFDSNRKRDKQNEHIKK